MSQVVCMHAMAKVAWEVIDGVCGGRRRNVEKEGEESSDKASHNVETGAPLYPYETSQAKSSEADPKWLKPTARSKTTLQKKARGEECNRNSVTNSLVVKMAEPKTRRMTDEKREKRKAKKVVSIPQVNEISAPSCGHGIKKLPSTADADQVTTTTQKTPEPLLHVDSGDDDHSPDLATSELWSCRKEPIVEENREKKRLKPAKVCEQCDIRSDSLAERDEKDYIKSFRHRRVMEQLERAEALDFKAKVERMMATQKIFGNNYRTPEQIAHDLEMDRFECASIYVYTSESSSKKSSSYGCRKSRVRGLINIIEEETTSDILDDLIERSKGSTERRGGGGAPLYTSASVRHARSTKTEAGMTTMCSSGPENVHNVSHCNICMAGLQLEPSALLHQLKENHSMANWTPPFVRITVADRQESGISEAERGFIDGYRQAYASGLLCSPPEDKFLRRTTSPRAGENRKRPRKTGQTKKSSSMPLSAEEGRNIGGSDMLQTRRQRRVGREGNNPCQNNQKLFQEEGGQPASLQHRFEPHRTRSFVKALQEEKRV